MSYRRKALSSAGSLKSTFHIGGNTRKLSRHLSSACHGGSSFSIHGGTRLKRTSQDSFDCAFGPGSIHTSFGHNNGWKNENLFRMNSKETMKFLNDRLANYLEEVAELEEENNRLERKMQAWYEKHSPKELPNFNCYFKTIEELQKEISNATIENAQAILNIDNARLAGDDLLNKFNMELSLHNNIEEDIQALTKGLDRLNLDKCDLELQIEFLLEDVELLKKSHIEEVKGLEMQLGARVNVEVDAAPSVDLSKVLLDVRNEYERVIDKNMKDVESWFVVQVLSSEL
ncbi:hypothetical protein GDO81_013235 [Engystomops pustulosus]|uniref:IF rod domain-containing protein n=1 Tax=Engystomops pustulosus TaxID=76066 RepID=A0AAV7AXU0_ENGPU|nr:hypothetical protein GDO81_013235 [Engystomops pustulosus]